VAVSGDGVYITGYTRSFGAGVVDGSEDPILVKYDSEGNQLWNTTWEGAVNDAGYGLAVGGDEVYVAGRTKSIGAGLEDGLLIKYDAYGNQLWNTTWGGANDDYFREVVVGGDGVYVVGYTDSFGAGNTDAITVKFDFDGNQLWNTTWGGGHFYPDAAYGAALSTDGVYVVGKTFSFGAGGYDAFLIEYDSDGNQLWNTTWGGSNQELYGGLARAGVAVSDDSIYLSGDTFSFGQGSPGRADVFLVKYALPTSARAGDDFWTKTYGGSQSDLGWSVQQTADGGYSIGGWTSTPDGKGKMYLLKTDSEGALQWNRTYPRLGTGAGYSAQQTTDNGYVIVGTVGVGDTDSDVYLVRTDSDGYLLWNKTYGGSQWDAGLSVQLTADGGYILVGLTNSFSEDSEIYLVKTDAAGNLQWNKTFQGSIYGSRTVQQTSDGGYVITGGIGSLNGGDMLLLKTDSTGNHLWNRTYGGPEFEMGRSVQETSDGGYIVTGDTWSYGEGEEDVYLVKTDSEGNLLWNRTFGGSDSDWGRSVEQSSDGGYIVAGWTHTPTRNQDVLVLKVDAEGDLLWSSRFGGSRDEWAISVQQTDDGGYIVTGGTRSYGEGGIDVYLIKLGKDFEPISSFTEFSVNRDFVVETEDDLVEAGLHTVNPRIHMNIWNEDDSSDTVLGDLAYEVRAENITEVYWEEYADWNETHAIWEFPSNYYIEEDDERGVGYRASPETRRLNMTVTRWMNQTVFNAAGYQLAEFDVTFQNLDFRWAWINIYTDEEYASIVPDSFSTDASGWLDDDSPDRVHFEFDYDELQAGVSYSFTVLIFVDSGFPILYKPEFTAAMGVYHQEAYDVGLQASMPQDMLPEGTSYASVSTNTSSNWCILRHDHMIAKLEQVAEQVSAEWEASLDVALDSYTTSVDIGMKNDATNGFDLDHDEMTAPSPPTGVQAYLWYPDNPPYQGIIDTTKLITSIIPVEYPASWTLKVKAIGVSGETSIAWDGSEIDEIPDEYNVMLEAQDKTVDMREASQYSWTAEADVTYTFTVRVTREIEITLELRAGWNMVSLPVEPEDLSVLSDVGFYQLVTWSGSGYVSASSFEPGRGYWALVLEQTTINLPRVLVIQVQIGYISPQSSGIETSETISQLALDDINQYMRENGYQQRFEAVIKDAQSSVATHLQRVQELDDAGVGLIIGGGWSSQAQGSLSYVNDNDLLLVSSSSTSPLLSIEDNLFRLCPPDDALAPVTAAVMKSWGIDAAVVIYRDDIWGQGIHDPFVTAFQADGGVILDSIPYSTEVGDYSGYLAQAEASAQGALGEYNPENIGVLLLSFDESGDIIDDSESYPTISDVFWFGGDGTAFSYVLKDEVFEQASKLVLFSTYPASPDTQKFNDLADRFLEERGIELRFYTAAAYDAYSIIAQCVVDGYSSDPVDVLSLFSQVAEGFEGVSGTIHLDEFGDRTGINYDIQGYGINEYGEPDFIRYGYYDAETETVHWDQEALDGINRPLAEFNIYENRIVETENNRLDSGSYNASTWMHLDIYNNDDNSDTTFDLLGYTIQMDDINDVNWEEYSSWNSTYASWIVDDEPTIEEDDGFGVGLDTGVRHIVDLDVDFTRSVDVDVFSVNGSQQAEFTVIFRSKDFDHSWGHITGRDWGELFASPVPGTFQTDAPLDWFDFRDDHVNFGFEYDDIVVGVEYHISVVFDVELTGEEAPPIQFIPGFELCYLIDSAYEHAGIGSEIQFPSTLLPEYVSSASASTDVENAWGTGYEVVVRGELQRVCALVGPRSVFELENNDNIETDGDTLQAGNHEANTRSTLELWNQDDTSEGSVDNLWYRVESSAIEDVWDDSYATWNSTYAEWNYPPDYTIEDDENEDVSINRDNPHTVPLLFSITRVTDQSEFSTDGIQQVEMTATFTNNSFEHSWGHIDIDEQDGVYPTLVPDSFETNAPLNWLDVHDHGINFGIDPDDIVVGTEYYFRFQVNVTLTIAPPILYKPQFELSYSTYTDVQAGELSQIASMPNDLLPSYLDLAQISCEPAQTWTYRRGDHISGRLNEIYEPLGARAELGLKNINEVSSGAADILPAGNYAAETYSRLEIWNQDDTTQGSVDNLWYRVESSDITDISDSDWADWNATYAEWTYDLHYTLEDDDSESVRITREVPDLTTIPFTLTRTITPSVFNEDGIQQVEFTFTFTDNPYEDIRVNINVDEDRGVYPTVVAGTMQTNATLNWVDEDEHGFHFGLSDNLVVGTIYRISFQIYVDLTGEIPAPILYKPEFRLMCTTYEDEQAGELSDTASFPVWLLPDYIDLAHASCSPAQSWFYYRRDMTIGKLGHVAEQDWVTNPANGHEYKLLLEVTWEEAEAQAVELGGHLVTINDVAEELWIHSMYSGLEMWIGFNDIDSEGTWVWSSGQPVTYTNWDLYEPNNEGEGGVPEDAAAIYLQSEFASVFWNDLSPYYQKDALIEREP